MVSAMCMRWLRDSALNGGLHWACRAAYRPRSMRSENSWPVSPRLMWDTIRCEASSEQNVDDLTRKRML
jgi:hypothetical protein